jgi:HlyD family type I secretion membrane fusion protein
MSGSVIEWSRGSETALAHPVRFERSVARSSRGLIWVGSLVVLLGAGGLVGWAAWAPLRSAALAPGVVKVAGERRLVQHLEGGIVSAVLVREGESVQAGQPLVRLMDVIPRARLSLLALEHDAVSAEIARLEAELDDLAEVRFSDRLRARRADPAVARLIEGEQRLFRNRRDALLGQVDVLQQRKRQTQEKIVGRQTEIAATRTKLSFILQEIQGAETLLESGMYLKTRYYALKRSEADLEGLIGRLNGDIAEAQAAIGETDLRIIDLRNRFRSEAADRLQDLRARLRDVDERLDAAEDSLARTVIRSPATGTVMGLRTHTTGGVIASGAPIMEIVPTGEPLVVEVQVQLQDVDRIWAGMPAEVRFSAFSTRATPIFEARVIRVSPDRVNDPTRQRSYYVAEVALDRHLTGDLTLQPGMPAEVFLLAGTRTPLDYLLKPVREQMKRGMTER